MGKFTQTIAYAGNQASALNHHLRANPRRSNEHLDSQEAALNKELDQLPGHNHLTVYAWDNCTHIPFHILAVWYEKRIGEIITFPNFLSTTKVKERWLLDGTWYEISTSSDSRGRDIEDVVDGHAEKEVLFKSNTSFIIKGVDKQNTTILLEEVKPNANTTVLYTGIFTKDEQVDIMYQQEFPRTENRIIIDIDIEDE